MNCDTTFYYFLLDSHNIPHDIKDMNTDQLDKCHKLTQQFVNTFLQISTSNLPPQKHKSLEIMQQLISDQLLTYRIIGYVRSIFTECNGTPRQAILAPHTLCYIEFLPWIKPELAIRDLEQYSHVQVLFTFHKNHNKRYHPLVHPPKKRRPNNIGLSCCSITKVDGNKLYLNGIDFLDGTPIIDIKPYTHSDSIQQEQIKIPNWLIEASNTKYITVQFSQIEDFIQVTKEVLQLDIRTVHMQQKHDSKHYGVMIDRINVTFEYNDSGILVNNAEYIPTGKFNK
ncbi:TsaA-like domain-containing protein [Entamoeba marina]